MLSEHWPDNNLLWYSCLVLLIFLCYYCHSANASSDALSHPDYPNTHRMALISPSGNHVTPIPHFFLPVTDIPDHQPRQFPRLLLWYQIPL